MRWSDSRKCESFPAMRALLTVFLTLGITLPVSAQEQERKLIDRVLKPDTELANTTFDVPFYGGDKFGQGEEAAVVREFQFEDRVNSKSFQTRDFVSSSYWAGDFKFNAKDAVNGKGKASETAGQYDTRAFATEEANEASRTNTVREYGEAGKKFAGKEAKRLEKVIDPSDSAPGWKGNMDVMTVDDIRDLLNKK